MNIRMSNNRIGDEEWIVKKTIAKKAWNNSGICGIRTLDLCDTGVALYQLSEQANRGRWSFIQFDIKDDDGDAHDKGGPESRKRGRELAWLHPPAAAKETNDYNVASYDLTATTMAIK